MTPSSYPEQRFRHSQRAPAWKDIHLGKATVTMGSHGCMVTCAAYLMSRFYGRDITPGDLVKYLNQVDGFTKLTDPQGPGLMRWDKFTQNTSDAYPDGALRLSILSDKTYTLIAVRWGSLVHWVVQ